MALCFMCGLLTLAGNVQVDVPQWQVEDPSSKPSQGGSVAVVYYKGSDTYSVCSYLAGDQRDGYPGSCTVKYPTPPATPPHE